MLKLARNQAGIYQLHLHLPKAVRLRVGKLGTFLFPAGRYIYTGSALSGLEQRLSRHRRQRKKAHWHIDRLLSHARITFIRVRRTRRRLECLMNREVLKRPGAQVLVRGFGSSDCSCPAHLVYLGGPRRSGSSGSIEAGLRLQAMGQAAESLKT